MERRQFVLLRRYIDKVKAENISIFEKAQQLASLSGAMQIIFAIITTIYITIGRWLGMSEFDE